MRQSHALLCRLTQIERIQMRGEYLFYNFRREHKIMRPTDRKLASEEEVPVEEVPVVEVPVVEVPVVEVPVVEVPVVEVPVVEVPVVEVPVEEVPLVDVSIEEVPQASAENLSVAGSLSLTRVVSFASCTNQLQRSV